MGSSMSLEERFYALIRQHELIFGESLVLTNKRCSKCQGLGHTPSVCPNKAIITLAEWEAAMEEENEEKNEDERDHELEETQDHGRG